MRFTEFKIKCISCNYPFILLQIAGMEIEEMIKTVDKNGDGKISYSEFRYVILLDNVQCIASLTIYLNTKVQGS